VSSDSCQHKSTNQQQPCLDKRRLFLTSRTLFLLVSSSVFGPAKQRCCIACSAPINLLYNLCAVAAVQVRQQQLHMDWHEQVNALALLLLLGYKCTVVHNQQHACLIFKPLFHYTSTHAQLYLLLRLAAQVKFIISASEVPVAARAKPQYCSMHCICLGGRRHLCKCPNL
jgi:hypothetical protein